MDDALVPGRACGDCTVCCVQPRIDAPELQKLAGATCVHCTGTGCGIYAARPGVCRAWFCGFRTLDWIDDSLRPDLAGVVSYFTAEEQGYAHNFLVMAEAALDNPAVIGAMCLSIERGLTTLLVVNGVAGRRSITRVLNGMIDGTVPEERPVKLQRELKPMFGLLSMLVAIDGGPVKPFVNPKNTRGIT